MFERYTQKARRTIFFARYEASQFSSPYRNGTHVVGAAARGQLAAIEERIDQKVRAMEQAVANHEFDKARAYTVTYIEGLRECKRATLQIADPAVEMDLRRIFV